MDAVEFIKERDRMLEVNREAPSLVYKHELSAEKIVAIVEEWSAAHPRKTRQSVFLELFPNTRLDADGVIDIEPCQMEPGCYPVGAYGCKNAPCVVCRQEFWMQEVE